MHPGLRTRAVQVLFFVWAFAAVVGILTTEDFLVFGAGAILWVMGNAFVLVLSLLMLRALHHGTMDDLLRVLTGVMATVVTSLLLLTYLFVDRDVFARIATQPDQLLVLLGVSVVTMIYSFKDNEYVHLFTTSDIRKLSALDPDDPTNIDRSFNERALNQVTGGSRWEPRSGCRSRTGRSARSYR